MPETTFLDIPERVARGAALLDEKRPGWWQRIHLDTLNINDCGECVIGQLYTDPLHYDDEQFDEGAIDLVGENAYDNNPHAPALVEHGFSLERGAAVGGNERYERWAALTAEWKRVISERRESLGVPSGGES
ncbi:hypothetical protein FXF51_05715 [Nonomuraea sp. PA05]|uniref:hypothetical protein n=1 Tax=Nonomuraea sp. PA05 TaxID=2604466 RepID=UPI0011D703CF|nr:hypothetical protein [Nonomuraea sp. PA05]TYB69657.1 hypothetical protein FXF51_05715 [Nonomuraea sp. PA05]